MRATEDASAGGEVPAPGDPVTVRRAAAKATSTAAAKATPAAAAAKSVKRSRAVKRRQTFVLDTSVLLSDPAAFLRFEEHEVVLPLVVISELEGKRNHPELGYFARQSLRFLDELRVKHGRLDQPLPLTEAGGTLRVELNHADPEVLPHGFRADTNDARILAVALGLAAEGCDVTLVQGLWDKDAKYGFRSWTSKEKRVADGTVSFIVRTSHTRGMSVNVRAPWEGGQPFVTQVAMRYAGEQVGDRIGFREARSKSKAAPCFAGTAEDTLTIPVTVREVMVQGHTERVAGTIAYSKVTQPWLAPMNPAARGVTGTQDIQLCGERPN